MSGMKLSIHDLAAYKARVVRNCHIEAPDIQPGDDALGPEIIEGRGWASVVAYLDAESVRKDGGPGPMRTTPALIYMVQGEEEVHVQTLPTKGTENGGRYVLTEIRDRRYRMLPAAGEADTEPRQRDVRSWLKSPPQMTREEVYKYAEDMRRYWRHFVRFYDGTKDIEELYYIMALWCMGTFLADALNAVVYTGFVGNTNSGKSQALETLARASFYGEYVANATEAATFRLADYRGGTLCVDEFEKASKTEWIRAVYNQGQKRGPKVIRCNPETLEVEYFDMFGPKAFACIEGVEAISTMENRTYVWHMIRDPEFTPKQPLGQPKWTERLRRWGYALRLRHGPTVAAWCRDAAAEEPQYANNPFLPSNWNFKTKLNGREQELLRQILAPLALMEDPGNEWQAAVEWLVKLRAKRGAVALDEDTVVVLCALYDLASATEEGCEVAYRLIKETVRSYLMAVEGLEGPALQRALRRRFNDNILAKTILPNILGKESRKRTGRGTVWTHISQARVKKYAGLYNVEEGVLGTDWRDLLKERQTELGVSG